MTKISPAEFDAGELALMTELGKAEHELARLDDVIHHLVGDKKAPAGRGRPAWQMTEDEVQWKLTILVTTGGDEYVPAVRMRPSDALAQSDELFGQVTHLRDRISDMEVIYRADPWTRWYPCLNDDGHIHSDASACPTLHRMGQLTSMGWETRLSGQPVGVVIADLGPRLCSVCFPAAPAEHCRSLSDITRADREAARNAKKTARDAALAVKNLTDSEAAMLREATGERVTTVAAAKAVARQAAETAVELEWSRSQDARRKWAGMEDRLAAYIARAEARLEAERAAAELASEILVAREAAAPGTGWTREDADRAVLGATKRTRKAYFG